MAMMVPERGPAGRRAFLRMLAASPALAAAGFAPDWLAGLLAPAVSAQSAPYYVGDGMLLNAPPDWVVIKSVREALNVFDFQAAARVTIPVQHYVFVNEGVFNQETDIANRVALGRYQVRPRRMSNFGSIDQSLSVFGAKWDSPIFLCPGGEFVHPDGAGAIARAAKARRVMRIGGQQTGVNPPDDPLVWATSQGPPPDPGRLQKLDAAGCPAYVWNIDHGGGGNQIGARGVQRAQVPNLERSKDQRCNSCHETDGPGGESSGPYAGRRITIDDPLDILGAMGSRPQDPRVRTLTWDDVSRAKERMKRMKLVLKGIQTGEDADLAIRHGADGIEVSNHGGHADAFGRGAIECLPEVVAAAKGRVPVFIDSGFRAGIDIYKALALGATAVGIARPKAWAVGAFGQEGVETLITLLRRELQVVMADTGASTIAKINRSSLMTRSL